jgi:hypothetical protein
MEQFAIAACCFLLPAYFVVVFLPDRLLVVVATVAVLTGVAGSVFALAEAPGWIGPACTVIALIATGAGIGFWVRGGLRSLPGAGLMTQAGVVALGVVVSVPAALLLMIPLLYFAVFGALSDPLLD